MDWNDENPGLTPLLTGANEVSVRVEQLVRLHGGPSHGKWRRSFAHGMGTIDEKLSRIHVPPIFVLNDTLSAGSLSNRH
jgi:hypothetical protein